MTKTRWGITAATAAAALLAGFVLGTTTESSAAPAKQPQAVTATPVCEGVGSASFCHLTIAPDGTEWLFDEDGHGTIVFFKQTPPK